MKRYAYVIGSFALAALVAAVVWQAGVLEQAPQGPPGTVAGDSVTITVGDSSALASLFSAVGMETGPGLIATLGILLLLGSAGTWMWAHRRPQRSDA